MLDEYNTVLTIQELMEVLNIGRNSAYELLNSGAIRAFRIGSRWKYRKMLLLTTLDRGKKPHNIGCKSNDFQLYIINMKPDLLSKVRLF